MNKEYVEEFIKYKNDIAGLSFSTLETYKTHINKFCNYIKKDLKDVIQIDVINWLSSLKESGLSNRSRNNMLIAVKQILIYLKTIKKINIDEDILIIENSKIAKREKKAFSEEELIELVDVTNNVEYKAIILLIGRTGMRFGELSQMTMEHYQQMEKNLSNGFTLIGKGNKERRFFPTDECFKLIKKYVETRRIKILENNNKQTDVLWLSRNAFPLDQYNFNRTLKKIAKKIDYPFWEDISVHNLRHTAATIWLKKGYNIKTISNALGHSSIAVTDTYVHSNQSDVQEMMSHNVDDELKKENELLKKRILELEELINEIKK